MNRSYFFNTVCGLAVLATTILPSASFAGGLRGGGGARPGGGGARPSGGARPGGGISRPSASSRPSGGISRPSPNISRPSPGISRPSPNISRPSPSINRPSPSISRPSQIARPTPTPSRPSIHDFNRPTTRPGGGVSSLPDFSSRPGSGIAGGNRPNIGSGNVVNRPSTRPTPGGGIAGRPDRPSSGDLSDFLSMKPKPAPLPGTNLPSRPGTERPSIDRPIANLPGTTLPGGNRPGGDRPSIERPGGDRPTIDRPIAGLPGGNRPGGDRPGGDRPTVRPSPLPGAGDFRPGNNRPGSGGDRWPDLKPGGGNRPIRPDRPPVNIGDITGIGNRPGWANLRPGDINVINNNWNNIINRPTMNNWINNHPNRWDHWHRWGNGIGNRWPGYQYGWFNNNWWHNHPCNHCWWHYHGYWGYRPWNYWWRYPSWGQVVAWFPSYGWSNNACFYDYGPGGNVVYQDNSVYIDGQQVATSAQFAQSAAALAAVDYPSEPDEELAAKMDWLPLGTFAISSSENDKNTTRTIQLAVNQDGVVTGTFYNQLTDKTYPVQGRVDKETQRVAFTIGNNNDVIMETGIFNLTQDTAPALVHHGTSQTDTYLLVRLDPPADDAAQDDSPLP